MSRRVKLPTKEMGELQLLIVWEKDGKWEPEWEPLRGTKIGDQFSIVSQDVVTHALNGLSRPLVDALGIPPEGSLRKLPKSATQCALRKTCPFYVPAHCVPNSPKMPWCYEPDGITDARVITAAARAIEEWRAAVYVVIVRDQKDDDAR